MLQSSSLLEFRYLQKSGWIVGGVDSYGRELDKGMQL